MRILTNIDDRDHCPIDQKTGVYVVMKKNTLARFTFGKESSSFKDAHDAFGAMQDFMRNRKDADDIRVTLLNTHR